MKTIFSLAVSSVLAFQPAFAADKNVICEAKGMSLSRMGSTPAGALAKFTFVDTTNDAGVRVLKNVVGNVKTIEIYQDYENNYLGSFKFETVTENSNYRPRRYVGYSQFKDFNAASTEGSQEDGMWGEFVLEKNTHQPKFQAHYIFKAGDHMGGTMHFTCSVQ